MRSDRPLVVLLPHPDDEFAVLPFLKREAQHGRELHLVWMTNGAVGRTLPALRAEESRNALAANGLGGVNSTFLGMDHALPDGRLHEHLVRAYAALTAHLDALQGSFELWIPAWEGGHQDHDATHALGCLVALGRGALVREYPTYHGAGRRGPLFRVLSPLPGRRVVDRLSPTVSETWRLLLTCFCYRSQWRSFLGLLPMITLHLLVFRRPMVLCEVDPAMPMARPHSGALLYERRTAWRWDDLQSAIQGLWR
ncbi:MAG: PIG-L deacetylase family protein [Fimbriimonadaceae bacterium]